MKKNNLALACLTWAWVFSTQSLLLAGTPTPVQSSDAQPQAVLVEFYHWYLDSLAQHHNPLSDEPAKMKKYVSEKLLQQINQEMNSSEGLDEDYFTKAQDYFEDWRTHISVSEVRIKGGSASALVTLGATKDSKQSLKLSLVLEGTSWKISKVR